VAYTDIADQFSPVASAIIIFALCGFANLSSIAILLGGLGAIAPARRDEISRFGLRALLAATLSNLMSAALAGLFLSLGS
jgi:CNT family concentrative nucleoside transporter